MSSHTTVLVLIIIVILLAGGIYFKLHHGQTSLSKEEAQMVKKYCIPGSEIDILKNASGEIGAYIAPSSLIMDTPIMYYGPDGKLLTTYHIFGTDQEKVDASKIIDDITLRFPIKSTVKCK